jgi:uncharacterized protein
MYWQGFAKGASWGCEMRFEWDDRKNKRNLLKHEVRFETAALVFDDPLAISQRDCVTEEEERWITIGAIAPGVIVTVVHTQFELDGEEVIRIISARAAESHERSAYAETQQRTAAGHRRHRGKKRRGHW